MSALTRQTLPTITPKLRLAVFKFASCDGCQLSLLDCEDELVAVASAVEIAYFLEATSKVELGPYDVALVEGSITTPHDARRIQEVRRQSKLLVTIGACATSGGIQALRNWASHSDFLRWFDARPDYIDSLATSTAIAEHVPVDFELRGCPINRHQLVEVLQSLVAGRAADADAQRVPRLQASRHGLRDGRSGYTLSGPCHAVGVRGDLPVLRPRLLRMFWARGPAELRCPGRPSDRWRNGASRARAALTKLQRGGAGVSRGKRSPRGCGRNESSKGPNVSETRTIKVDALSRVEGEGGLHVSLQGDVVEQVRLSIYEPPRFFEAFLKGRPLAEVPDLVARICGICPVAYQMSSVHALEQALDIAIRPEVRRLRRLLYCGEWIESHALHVHLLHAPDFFGCDSGLDLVEICRDEFQRGLRLKKHGNELLEMLGGRAIHPVNVAVGGFYRAPRRADVERLDSGF